MASTNLRPIGDRVLVEAAEEKETKKGGKASGFYCADHHTSAFA